MKKQIRGEVRFLIVIVLSLMAIDCRSESNQKGCSSNIVPLCAHVQNMEIDYFDKVETVDDNIRNSLRRLHDFDLLQQKMSAKMGQDVHVDYVVYLNKRMELLAYLNAELLKKRKNANKFSDTEIRQQSNDTNFVNRFTTKQTSALGSLNCK